MSINNLTNCSFTLIGVINLKNINNSLLEYESD